MDLFNKVKDLAESAVRKIQGLGDDLKKDLEAGVGAIQDEENKLKDTLKQDLQDIEADLVNGFMKGSIPDLYKEGLDKTLRVG